MATAVALIPPTGAVVMPIVGGTVYPVPSLIKSIYPRQSQTVSPLGVVAFWTVAVAVLAPRPTIVNVVI